MSAILATNMTNNMSNRAGYLTFNQIMDENLMYYTFKDCIKYHQDGFHSWICYWEGSPIAVKCIVKASVLSNGFTKIAILSKELTTIDEIGLYPSKKSWCLGYILDGTTKFMTNNGVQRFVTTTMVNGFPVETTKNEMKSSVNKVLSDAEVQHLKAVIASNWGCTLK